MNTRCSVWVICTLGTALVAPATTYAQFAIPQCDRLIDESYSGLADHEKQARLAAYGGCWKRAADAQVRANYRDILAQVDSYERNVTLAIESRIRTEAGTARQIMDSEHEAATLSLQQQFVQEYAGLELERTADNHYEVQRRMNEITRRKREAETQLRAAQRAEQAVLADRINDVSTQARAQVSGLVTEDKISLAEQLQEKQARLQRVHDALVDPSMDRSVADHAAAQPIGTVQAIDGRVTIIRPNGDRRPAAVGDAVHMGDVVETDAVSAVNLVFIDDTSFAVSEDQRHVIDEYVFDPGAAESPASFSLLKAIFVFTSGLIGRDDPDDILEDTPVGTLGIRG